MEEWKRVGGGRKVGGKGYTKSQSVFLDSNSQGSLYLFVDIVQF